METLFLCSRELVKKQGRGYEITIFGNETMRLLFWAGRDYVFTILVGRDYEFTEVQHRLPGTHAF